MKMVHRAFLICDPFFWRRGICVMELSPLRMYILYVRRYVRDTFLGSLDFLISIIQPRQLGTSTSLSPHYLPHLHFQALLHQIWFLACTNSTNFPWARRLRELSLKVLVCGFGVIEENIHWQQFYFSHLTCQRTRPSNHRKKREKDNKGPYSNNCRNLPSNSRLWGYQGGYQKKSW